ncbi:hypothetical protein ACFX1S_003377 [Malus domestica]
MGYTPSLTTYNSMMYMYSRSEDYEKSEQFLGEIIEKADSLFEEAIDVVCYMIKNGCKPNQNTYNSIVDWYCKHNRRDNGAWRGGGCNLVVHDFVASPKG